MKPIICILALIVCLSGAFNPASAQPADDSTSPKYPAKLIFIHHSTGENWLADENGGLGLVLAQANYYVSDTNYGWGPNGIGDRTDIPNWLEWFRSEDTDQYMQALFNESGQNSAYSRTLPDPGGENEIILFKSCFPNSNLEGTPNDAPAPGDVLTVGNAKYIYTELLKYFITRPDKLFIVITAPPLADFDTDEARAANARAFNNWLMNDWLSEYPYANVAVFDFYNVLTSGANASTNDAGQPTGNHHRWWEGMVQHLQTVENNFLIYPSGDSHPSYAGNKKATVEFVPLLNVFYHRWKAGVPADQPTQPPIKPTATQPPEDMPPAETPVAHMPGPASQIDAFESIPPDTPGWQPFWDEGTLTKISCAPTTSLARNGARALEIDFNVAANNWATCVLFFDQTQDWSAWEGVSFYLRASQPALVFDVDIYLGTAQSYETYLFTIETPPESVNEWVPVVIPWEQLLRADWEAASGTPLRDPPQVAGLAFGFNTYADTPNAGQVWVDDLELFGGEEPQIPVPAATETDTSGVEPVQTEPATEEVAPTEKSQNEVLTEEVSKTNPTQTPVKGEKPSSRVCPSVLAAPLVVIAMTTWWRKQRLGRGMSK